MIKGILKAYIPDDLKKLSVGELAGVVKSNFISYRNKCTLTCSECGHTARYADYYRKFGKHEVAVKCWMNNADGTMCKSIMEVDHDNGIDFHEPAFSLLLEETMSFINKFANASNMHDGDYSMHDEGIELLLRACVAFNKNASDAKFTTYFWSLLKNKSEELAYRANRTRRIAHVTCPSCKRKAGRINIAHLLEDFNVFKPLDCSFDTCVLSKKYFVENGEFGECPFNGIIGGAKCHARLHRDIIDEYGRHNFINVVGAGAYPNISNRFANCYTATQRDILRTRILDKFKEAFPGSETEGRQISINDVIADDTSGKLLERQDVMMSSNGIVDDDTGIEYANVDDKICVEQISKKCADIMMSRSTTDNPTDKRNMLLLVYKCMFSGMQVADIADVCGQQKRVVRYWVNVAKKDPIVRGLVADIAGMKEADIIIRRDGKL